MNLEMRLKKSFIENELEKAVKTVSPNVRKLQYIERNGSEFCYIDYGAGHKIRVNITTNSLSKIGRDVFAVI